MVDEICRLAPAVDDADRIERIRQFERLKAVAAAEQMNEAVEFASSQRIDQAARGVPAARQDRGIVSQLALARRVSPWAAQRWLGWGRVLTAELPATFAELRAGCTSEWRAVLVARETAFLSRPDRGVVDSELAPRLHSLGDRAVDGEARKIAYRLDPAAAVRRASNAGDGSSRDDPSCTRLDVPIVDTGPARAGRRCICRIDQARRLCDRSRR
jgi:hypothetical protein